MALKVWLPLNGTLENKGISEITLASGTPTYTNGKIGQCLNTGTLIFNLPTNFINNISTTKQYSICCWCKDLDASAGSRWVFMLGSGTGTSRGLWEGNSTTNRHWAYSGSGHNIPTSINTIDGKWHHIVFTVNNNIVSLYVDGIYQGQNTAAATGELGGNNTVQLNATNYNLNDFRIYDHCLSAKEVKEISQGLILHYKLDGLSGGANENLTPCGGTYTRTSPWTTTKTAADGWAFIPNSAFEAKSSTSYTISVECDGTLSDRHAAGSIAITDKPWSFWAYVCNTDTTKSWTTGGYDRAINLTSANNNYRKIGNRHVWTITLSSTEKYLSLRTNSYSDGSTSVTINWWNIKVEEGTNATDWIQPLADLGIDTNKIADSSGYGNDGTILSNPYINSDADRYQISTYFDGVDDGILIENLTLSSIINDQVSYSFWIKPEGENGGRSIYFGSYSSTSWSVEKTAGNILRLYWNGSPDETCSGATITDGIWQHIVITKNGANNIKVYINGVQKWTSTAAHNTLSFPTTYRIGRDTRTGDGTPYHGLMSDFRIYATALSADDILDLYHTPANIDNLNRLHTFELNETFEKELIKDFSRLGVTGYTTGSAECTKEGITYTGKVWAPNGYIASDYIPIKNSGYTYYYDTTYSNTGGGMFYIGFERFDENKTATSNSSCVYPVGETTERNYYRKTGTVNFSTDANGNPVKYIRVRILTDWNNSARDDTRVAKIHHLSVKEVPNTSHNELKIYENGIYEGDEIFELNENISRIKNTGLSEYNGFIEK